MQQRSPSAAARDGISIPDQDLESVVNHIATLAEKDFTPGIHEDFSLKKFVKNPLVQIARIFIRIGLPPFSIHTYGFLNKQSEKPDVLLDSVQKELTVNITRAIDHVNKEYQFIFSQNAQAICMLLSNKSAPSAHDLYNAIITHMREPIKEAWIKSVAAETSLSEEDVIEVVLPNVIFSQAKNIEKDFVARYPKLRQFLNGASDCFHPYPVENACLHFKDPKYSIRANSISDTHLVAAEAPYDKGELSNFFEHIIKNKIKRVGVFVDRFEGHCDGEFDSMNWFLHPKGTVVLKDDKFKVTVHKISEGYEKLYRPLDENKLSPSDRRAVRVELSVQGKDLNAKCPKVTVYFFKTKDNEPFECLGADESRKKDFEKLESLCKHSIKENTLIHCRAGVGRTGTAIFMILLARKFKNILAKMSERPTLAEYQVAVKEILQIMEQIRQDRPAAIATSGQLKRAILHAFKLWVKLYRPSHVASVTKSTVSVAESKTSSVMASSAGSTPKASSPKAGNIAVFSEPKLSSPTNPVSASKISKLAIESKRSVTPSTPVSAVGTATLESVAQTGMIAAMPALSPKVPELRSRSEVVGVTDKPGASQSVAASASRSHLSYFASTAPAFVDEKWKNGAVLRFGQFADEKSLLSTSSKSISKSVTRAAEPAKASLVAAPSAPVSETGVTVDAAMRGQAAQVGAVNKLPVSASEKRDSSVPKFLSRVNHFTADKELDEKELNDPAPSLLPTNPGIHAASPVTVSASASSSYTSSSMKEVLRRPAAPKSAGPSSRARAAARPPSPPSVPAKESAGVLSWMVTGVKQVSKKVGDKLQQADASIKNLDLLGGLPLFGKNP